MSILRTLVVALVSLLFITGPALAYDPDIIDSRSDTALERFQREVSGATALLEDAEGILIFPRVIKAGLGIGGEYGEGALRIGGRTVDYYNTAGASIGFQAGAQAKSVLLVFLDPGALEDFRASEGWRVGVDGSVALLDVGAGQGIDTTNIREPIVAFVFGQQGLMFNVTLEGAKFTRMGNGH